MFSFYPLVSIDDLDINNLLRSLSVLLRLVLFFAAIVTTTPFSTADQTGMKCVVLFLLSASLFISVANFLNFYWILLLHIEVV